MSPSTAPPTPTPAVVTFPFRRLIAIICALGAAVVLGAAGYLDPGTRTSTPSPLLHGFDPPEHDWQPGHRGVDLDIAIGNPVFAAGNGTVHFAGSVAGTPTVSIQHEDGIRTTYQPVFSQVSAGHTIRAGETIGTLAPSTDGRPGLHWGAKTSSTDYVNPLSLLDEPIIRLKPWEKS